MNIFSKKEIKITNSNNKNHKVVFIVMLLLVSLQTFSQNYKTVTAKNGDGIYSVLRDNQIPMSYIDEFIQLNNDKLKGSRELKIGETYKLPDIAVHTEETEVETDQKIPAEKEKPTKRFKIFGEKYQDVEIESNELAGAVYYLVAGHGGPDPGAVGKYKGKILCEDEYAYDITLRLARNLVAQGALVYMITRDNNDGIRDDWYLPPDKDEKCYPNLTIPSSHTPRLRQRKDAVNKLYMKHKGQYQRMIEIHIDSRSKGEKIDVFFYHDKRSTDGKKLAKSLRDVFDEKYRKHQPGRGYHGTVSQRNLYVLKYTYPVAAFIELGNINHHRDLLRFILVDNRQALANWLSEGVVEDFRNH
jgi:N-acetylmuramoyl-L-alanine amidase